MAATVTCPECSQALTVPEHALGKRVECPNCKARFQISNEGNVAASPRPERDDPPEPRSRRRFEEDYDDDADFDDRDDYEPRVRRRRARADGDWRPVRSGLTLIIAGIFVAIGMAVVAVCGGIMLGVGMAAMAQQRGGPPDLAAMPLFIVFIVLVAGGYLTCIGLTVVGNMRCAGAPEPGPRTLAFTSSGLLIAGIFCYLGALASVIFGGAMMGPNRLGPNAGMPFMAIFFVLYMLGTLLLYAQTIVFQFFLRSVAVAFRADSLARSIMGMIIFGFVAIALIILIAVVAGMAENNQRMRGDPSPLAAMGGCFIIMIGLGWAIWYIVTLFQVRALTER